MTEQTTSLTEACYLCHGKVHLNTPSKWKNVEVYRYISSLDVPEDGVICQTCRRDVTRVLTDPSHTPRWLLTTSQTCCIDECKQVVFSSLQGQTESVLRGLGLKSKVSPIPIPTPLCKHHYHMVYNKLYPVQRHCVTCGTALRRDSNPKLCPQPNLIQQHLFQHTNFEGTIKQQDKVCYTCYRSHLFIIQEEKTISKDSDLQSIIIKLSSNVHNTVHTVEELVESSLKTITVAVAKELLQGNALLLPDIQDMFSTAATKLAHQLQEDIDIPKFISPQLILSTLTTNLQHMKYTCKIKKFGTLIFRSGSDLSQPLSQALWKVRKAQQVPENEIKHTTTSTSIEHTEHTRRKLLTEINQRACLHINSFLISNKKHNFELSDTTIKELIADIDPILWEAICLLTTSPWEKKDTTKVSPKTKHTKLMRRFCIFCSVMFCINDNYTIPLHTLLTSITDGQGGLATLIKFLNQLGVCASMDTLARHIQQKHTDREQLKIKCLDSESFIIVSADNIDFKHSFARVSKGSNNSSWHGTFIQVVQPLPSLALSIEPAFSDHTLLNTAAVHSSCSSVAQPSCNHDITHRLGRKRLPSYTAGPTAKRQPKPRTGTEYNLQLSAESSSDQHPFFHMSTTAQKESRLLSLSDFLPNDQEKSAVMELKSELHMYMLQKVAVAAKQPDKRVISSYTGLLLMHQGHTYRKIKLFLS